MLPKFDEKKSTQVAGVLLKLRNQGGRMSYLKLIKLMYLIDRESLMRWGESLTGDSYVSMEHGQVLSSTYDLIKTNTLGIPSYWQEFISTKGHDVRLLKEPETDELSVADIDLIREIFGKFGRMNRWQLRDYHHALPEYRETTGPSLPVGYADVLKKVANMPDEQIQAILDELHDEALLERLAS